MSAPEIPVESGEASVTTTLQISFSLYPILPSLLLKNATDKTGMTLIKKGSQTMCFLETHPKYKENNLTKRKKEVSYEKHS